MWRNLPDMCPDYIEVARRETLLMREYLALPGERPNLNECVWIGDLPTSVPPPVGSAQRLQQLVRKYGGGNITTAIGPSEDRIGVYVRSDVLDKSENPLRAYLSDRRTHRRISDWHDALRDDRRLT